MLLHFERAAASISGIRAGGKCRFMTLACAYGPRNHPVARVIKELFGTWFQTMASLVTDFPEEYRLARQAWLIIKEKVSSKAKANKAKAVPLQQPICLSVYGLESQVCGIMSNVIVMLISLGWNPAQIDIWESPSGLAFVLGSFLDNTSHMILDIIDSYNALQFPRVSQHFDGKGIEKGVDFGVTFSLLRAYRRNKSGKEPRWKPEYAESRAAALETAFSGSLWPQSRVSDAFPDVSNECLRCAEPHADSLHDIYLCPHLFESEDSSILETNDLVEEAIEKANSNPCLWFRGIATIDLTQLPEEVMGYVYVFFCFVPSSILKEE